jgi:hypothetical protein
VNTRRLFSLGATLLAAVSAATVSVTASPAVAHAADSTCSWVTTSPTTSERTFCWKGHEWTVKHYDSLVGPGPNYWSASANNVWIDANDNLHLKITKAGNQWYCAEVIMVDNAFGGGSYAGYGTYAWTVASHAATIDRNAVLGLFQWDNTYADYAHREIDVELSRWGNAKDTRNGQYVVQPYNVANHLQKFTVPDTAPTSYQYTWAPGVVDWSAPQASPRTYQYAGNDVPPDGGTQQPRMNLWLNQGKAPSNGKPVEAVLSGFSYTPLPVTP